MKKLSVYRKQQIARTIARKVDLIYNPDDYKVCVMGSLGLSTKAICEATGLSHCQVTYRLNKGAIKRSEYRDGTSTIACAIIANAGKHVDMRLKAQLNKRMKELTNR